MKEILNSSGHQITVPDLLSHVSLIVIVVTVKKKIGYNESACAGYTVVAVPGL